MQPGLTIDRQTNLETERAFSAVASVSGLLPPSQLHHCLINPTTGNMKPFTAQFTVHTCFMPTQYPQYSWYHLGPDEKSWPTQSCTRGHPSKAYLCGLVTKTNYCCLSWDLMTWENKVVKKCNCSLTVINIISTRDTKWWKAFGFTLFSELVR